VLSPLTSLQALPAVPVCLQGYVVCCPNCQSGSDPKHPFTIWQEVLQWIQQHTQQQHCPTLLAELQQGSYSRPELFGKIDAATGLPQVEIAVRQRMAYAAAAAALHIVSVTKPPSTTAAAAAAAGRQCLGQSALEHTSQDHQQQQQQQVAAMA
jgi:hypothetical protein